MACNNSVKSFNYPIFKYKKQIIKAISESPIVIISGDLESGKTTQLPQYLLEAGLNNELCIGITQTEDIDVFSASKKVCKEMECTVGNKVGYQTIFVNKSVSSTKIKYLRDSVFLDIYLSDKTLQEFGIIIIEDIHIKSLKTVVLLALLNSIINDNKALKVLITTASNSKEPFCSYFNEAPIITIKSQLRTVSLIYEPMSNKNYFKRYLQIINRIHKGQKTGNILVFMADKDEIQEFCHFILNLVDLAVVSTYDIDQEILISEETKRTVIVGISETMNAIKINSVRFIIDCGIVKKSRYDINLSYNVVEKRKLSKLECDLRRNIVGRREKGICYRLYREKEYDDFLEEPLLSINFEDLGEIYLKFLAMELNPMLFDFNDIIDREVLQECKSFLNGLELIDDSNNLTQIGHYVNGLPLGIMEGMTLWWSQYYNCTSGIIIIMSMLKTNDVFIISKNQSSEEMLCHKSFFDEDGDHFTRLNIYNKFLENKTEEWCKCNFLNFHTLMEVGARVTKLKELLNIPLLPTYCEKQSVKNTIIKVFFRNICVRQSSGKFKRCYKNDTVNINQSSVLFEESLHVILYNEIIKTQGLHVHCIMKLDETILANFPEEMEAIKYSSYIKDQKSIKEKQKTNKKSNKSIPKIKKKKEIKSKKKSSFHEHGHDIKELGMSSGVCYHDADPDFDDGDPYDGYDLDFDDGDPYDCYDRFELW